MAAPDPAPIRIPTRNLAAHNAGVREALHGALDRVIDGGEYYRGGALKEFERAFARYCGTRYAVGVASGTVALYLALRASGIGPGDEVITAPNSDIGTTSAIGHAGATPVWVDVDDATFNIDPAAIPAAITPRTRAIMPVHLYGLPAEMDPIMDVARAHGLRVIEDAALATGAHYRDRPVGSFGHAGGFSFAATKVLGALGAAGMVTTDDAHVAARVRQLSRYGEAAGPAPGPGHRVVYDTEGLNVAMDVLQAAFLQTKMPLVETWITRRREIARLYSGRLTDAGGAVVVPRAPAHARHVFRTYVVRVKNRDRVRAYLRAHGIDTGIQYAPPLHLQPAYRHLGFGPGTFPVAEAAAAELLCLPIYPELTDEHVETVCRALAAAVEECR